MDMSHLTPWKLSVPSVGRIAGNITETSMEQSSDVTSAWKKLTHGIISKKSGRHMKSNTGGIGMSKSAKLLVAFAVGQITQLVLHAMVVSLSMWDNRRVMFCAAFGFVILFAAIVGTVIAKGQDVKLEREFGEKKSYLEWAEIAGDENLDKQG